MTQITDRAIIALLCGAGASMSSDPAASIIPLLLAIVMTASAEAVPDRHRRIAPIVYTVAAPFIPCGYLFLPLASYDTLLPGHWLVRLSGPIALVIAVTLTSVPLQLILMTVVVGAASGLLSWRTTSQRVERERQNRIRDGLQQSSRALENRNRELEDAQDYEVRLATLSERSRIARDIHDSVGHLLTRAIMQVEALKVQHSKDPDVFRGFDSVSTTLDQAMTTVRESVHDLHDDSVDVADQVRNALAGSGLAHTELSFEVDDSIPSRIGFVMVALARETVANTVRHSDATTLTITIRELPGIYQMIVQDDGSVEPASLDGGIGLFNMENRIRGVDGVLTISYDGGLRVFASIPRSSEGAHRS